MAEFNRRQISNRLKVSIPIQYKPCESTTFAGNSFDLGLGGLYLKTELPFNLGEHVSLMINLPTLEYAVFCEGIVAWANPSLASRKPLLPSGVGIEFVNLTSIAEEEIKRFINWRTLRDRAQTLNNNKETLEEGKICDLHSSCSFYLQYKGPSCGSQYLYFVNIYCRGTLGYRCKRRLWVRNKGDKPPNNMSPTGHLIII